MMQVLFYAFALGLFAFAAYSIAEVSGFERAAGFDAPAAPTWGRAIALGILGAVSLGAALVLRDGHSVRIPTPARIDELADRAEATALERARAIAEEQSADLGVSERPEPGE
jgi:hypothetical protein